MSTRESDMKAVTEAALRSTRPSSRRFWLLVLLLLVLTTWSTTAWIVQLVYGLGTAGYDDRSFWGIYEANLVSFIAVSYGGALVSAILRLTQARWRAPITRLAEATALFSLLVGMVFAVVHLGRPERVWRMLVTPQLSSPIFWDLVVISTYLLTTAIFLYLPLIPDIALQRDRLTAKVGWRARLYRALALGWQGRPGQRHALERGTGTIAILIIPIAVLVHSVLSWAFALTGRPGWNSTIMAPYFVVAALYAGVAMVILVVAGFRAGYGLQQFITPEHFKNLAYLLLTLNLAYLYFTFAELLTEGYVQSEETVAVLESLLLGQYAPVFLVFNLLGGLVPFLLIVIPRTRTIPGILVASALVVVGMWLKRMLIVVPAVTHPLIGGAWGTLEITWVAAGLTIGAAAAIPLLLMLFFKLFPLLSIYEMEELSVEEPEIVPGNLAVARQEGGLAS